jgi:hypothetical protein
MLGWQLLSDCSSLLEASFVDGQTPVLSVLAAFRKRAFHDASGMDLGAG